MDLKSACFLVILVEGGFLGFLTTTTGCLKAMSSLPPLINQMLSTDFFIL